MTIRWSLIAVLMLGGAATAQPPVPKTIVWNQRSPQAEARYGILGEVEKPGVYSSAAAQVTLQELIQRAGGLGRTASPALRIIRNGRGGQSVFFQPDIPTLLMPNDIIIVDRLHDPRLSATTPSSRSDNRVWAALVGLGDVPEIVDVHPDQAQLPNIMQMLGQSPLLAKSVRTILPPRLPQPQTNPLFDLLPNGAVLVFDRSLLVTANLPAFPPPQPLIEAAKSPMNGPLPVVNAAAPSMPRSQVEAQPVPFVVRPQEELPANPASLPAPGSRFSTPSTPTIALPSESASAPVQAPVFIEPAQQGEPELVGEPTIELPSPRKPGFDLWQLLGIGGTVASLVGVALVSRRFLDRQPVANDLPPAIANRLRRPPPMPLRRLEPEPIAEPDSDLDDDGLRDLLSGALSIESEPIELPNRIELSANIKAKLRSAPVFRVDRPETPSPHLIMPAAADSQATFFADVAAEESPIPAPHFRQRRPRSEAAAPPAAASGSIASPIERALSQLQEGPKS